MLAQASSGANPLPLLLLVGMGIFMWVMMRNQKRRAQQQQELQRAAEIGDEIMTTAGIFGTIVEEDEDEGTVIVEIAPGTRVKMLRSGIARVVGDDYLEDDDALEDDEVDADGEGPATSDPSRP